MTTPSPHPHPHILEAYAADTRVEIEVLCGAWVLTNINSVIAHPEWKFRIKPKRITLKGLDGKDYSFPEPMRVAPEYEAKYFVPYSSGVSTGTWTSHSVDMALLKVGFCQETEAGAIEQRAALVAACGGTV